MCLSWLVFFPETVYIWITLFFKPKMDLISTIIVFGFLEIQSNNVPVDDKLTKMYSKSNYQVTKLPRSILNQINKTYTLFGVWILFSSTCDQTVTFFQALVHLPQAKQKSWMSVFFFIISFYFSLGTVLMFTFRGDLQFSLSISLTLQYQNLKVVSS